MPSTAYLSKRRKLEKPDMTHFSINILKLQKEISGKRKATAVRPVLLLKIVQEEKYHSTKEFKKEKEEKR